MVGVLEHTSNKKNIGGAKFSADSNSQRLLIHLNPGDPSFSADFLTLSQYLCGFSPGALVSSHGPEMHLADWSL